MNPGRSRVAVRVVDVYPYRLRAGVPEYLLLRRARGAVYAGSWRMVGGKIEEDEAAWEAAMRELMEETGLTPLELWALPSPNVFFDWREDRINIAPAFAARVDEDPRLDREHDDWRWFRCEDAVELLKYPEQRRLVRLIDETLIKGAPDEWRIPLEADPRGSGVGS